MECLYSAGETFENSDRQYRACEFLVGHQNEDGGWGESYLACETGVWHDNPDGSQVVNTAWALLGLMYARYPKKDILRRGIRVNLSPDCVDGSYLLTGSSPTENGCKRALRVFSTRIGLSSSYPANCSMISYPNYKFYFPIKALGMYAHLYGDEKL